MSELHETYNTKTKSCEKNIKPTTPYNSRNDNHET